ncbi:DNA polymerase III subunit alpha [bacterium (Candidatus Blackallbacteria) CG17_big_fil_post_rev_8_21_14_2_50_48_46]|uniref:DNA polymerase III subunit alpha n=1 Tax=bacterium (Candidatus Blackallbacteria) CG17_big_fil_post_rev_8_21_14_2_50_48_46 TaxID=2014261 RepID=A0A2M7G6Z5_9BACT|nr:MAG: DNA polymerase III subunit alpha [bacterium (Candidatus Blackallbacteria) CG18_big_fil_WC_8_21_14_2_50_49_26]PIW17822.1 MAG: DNA polymerase III subunit alpha [bacterium (Candidatus Blackallbacteria) CG17_big_fil_post_rev_8_21_14_2_50_48_46]PIW48498.1 MAG: DNA polymerase III subunit alpha [bacterium (Candidatus Blackallbacteria) CG13_big_fil_rev_8_21_14_2_50_49_14]
MSAPQFVHCNVHTEFSLLDSTVRIKEVIAKAVEMGMPALAITDNGVMYGALEFYKQARKNGIKPLLGCEMYVAPKGIQDRTGRRTGENNQRLTLIAKNETGYRNLLKLVSESHIKGFYYKPRVDHEMLERHCDGLIAMSAGMGGELPQKLMKEDYAGAKQLANWYKERFDFYLELQDHRIELQQKINRGMMQLSKDLGIPVAATNDVHYLNQADSQLHEMVLCIADGKTLNDTNRYRYPGGPEYYLKSPEEMAHLFQEVPEALSNTLVIAEKCHVIIETGNYKLPIYDVPPGHTPESYLRELTWKGIRERYPDKVTPEIRQRVEFELGVIEHMGFPSYFLVVWDFINYARMHGISVGPGRGSAAGSIVSYALRITDIDPIPFQLLFERFLNPDRISMPDIDIDFCIERREEVIQYVTRKYGADKVAQILTVGTLGAKMVVRDIARTRGFAPSEADRLAKMIPTKPGVKLEEYIQEGSELRAEMNKNPEIKQLIEDALKLEGNARQVGVHAAGVVISRDSLDTVVPLRAEDGKLITQFTKDEVEEVGLLKMDFLGLRNLTMISKTLEILKESRGIELDMGHLPFDDENTYKLLSSGYTVGVFQLESSGMQKLVRRLMPNNIEDITALVALYRPGPLGSGMDKDFVERKFGRQPVTYYDTSLEEMVKPILKDTFGLILYQEQIMQISRVVAEFTPGEADNLRKAMGKKQADVMAKMKAKFIDGSEKKQIRREVSENLFNVMEEFAKYGFNKSHSAAYAYVAYQTAWLKANYPVEYMAALISSVMSTQDKVPLYVGEARRMKINILPPDINESLNNFSVFDKNIRFGLGAVKNLGAAAIENILAERQQNGPFSSFYDFCTRVDLRVCNKRSIESLIKAGAFTSILDNRGMLLHNLDRTMGAANNVQKHKNMGQISLFELDSAADLDFQQAPELEEAPEFEREALLSYEKEVIGIYVSGHPLDMVQEQVQAFAQHSVSELEELDEGRETILAGLVVERRLKTNEKNDTMLFLKIEDLTGEIEIFVAPKTFEKFRTLLENEDKLLLKAKIRPKRDENEPPRLALFGVYSLMQLESLRLCFPEYDIRRLTALRCLLQEFPGETPVVICSEQEPENAIAVGCDFWIQPEEKLMRRLIKSLGQENVILYQVAKPGVEQAAPAPENETVSV